MADKRLFHLRKQANTLYRSCLYRTYASEAQKQKHTHEEQLLFLRGQDQKHLLETKNHADALIAQINELRHHISSLPTAIQKDRSIPPYILSVQRQRIRETPKSADAAISRIEHVQNHLTDLQYEGYQDRSNSTMSQFEKEIAKMSYAEKEDKLRSMHLEEEAGLARLKRDSERLVRNVKEIEAMGRKGGSVDDLARKADPFQRDGRKSPTAMKEVKGKQDDAPKVKTAAPETKPPTTLADMQKELERKLKGG